MLHIISARASRGTLQGTFSLHSTDKADYLRIPRSLDTSVHGLRAHVEGDLRQGASVTDYVAHSYLLEHTRPTRGFHCTC